MNKTTRILLILAGLALLIYYAISRQPWGNMKSELKNFAIVDTAAITKIFMADKRGHQVLLQKGADGIWQVGSNVVADVQKINLLKATVHDIEVRNPLAKNEFNTVVARLASDAIKVEVYHDDEMIKTIYIGESTPDGTGTYMMLEGSTTPFVTHIPGFIGYLTPRFNTNPVKWKDKTVFDFTMAQIQQVQVNYPQQPEHSFTINNLTAPTVSDINNTIILSDPKFIQYYLSSFQKLALEGYDEDIPQREIDSIQQLKPYCSIQVVLKSGGSKKLTVYLKGIDRRTKDRYNEQGGAYDYDHDKYFAFIDDQPEMAYVQQYNFGRLFKTAVEFKSVAVQP